LLLPNRTNNIFETIVIPAPQFFTATYDVTIWTQYTSHMTQLIEQIISSQLPQGNCWKLTTPKGYWFIASVDGNSYTADANTDDFSQTERVIKYKFTIKVPGYILASSVPGAPVPIRKYTSSPMITFSTGIDSGANVDTGDAGNFVDEPFLGADDPTLPLTSGGDGDNPRQDQRRTNGTRLWPAKNDNVDNPDDPAWKKVRRGTPPTRFKRIKGIDKNGRVVTRLYRINAAGAQGESVLPADANLGGLTIIAVEDLDD